MASSTLIDLGLGNVCRACLSDEGEMKSVFTESSDNQQTHIFKIFEACTSLEISENDGLPGVICLACELRLNNAFSFRELCQKSNSTLRKYIENALRYGVKEDTAIEEKYPIETLDESIAAEYIIETKEHIIPEENHSENDVMHQDDSNDSDEKPLISRKQKNKCPQFSPDVVNQAIDESRKKYNEKRECRLCGFISSNSRGLSLHIAHLHKELKDKWCNVCYDEVDDLPNHLKAHNKSKSYSCTFCEKKFSSQGHLTEHIRSHSLERPFKCKECGKGFLSARHLKVHDRIHSGLKPFACPHCGRRFTQKGSLQGHIRTHTGLKPYQCEICEKKFTTSSALALHRSKTGHNSFTKLILPAENDEVVFKTDSGAEEKSGDNVEEVKVEDIELAQSSSSLYSEPPNQTSTASANKDANRKLCTVCGKTFGTASKLRLHMRVHTGETPYRCQYCAKRFSTRGQLVVHVRTHTGERPHVCHVCGKGFAQSSVLNTHMKLHTGRPEQCQVCGQRFCRPAELRLHMRKHTGEKPYLCTECGQAFIQRSHLMEHIKIHSDERPYRCHVCERAFKQSSSLKSHLQIHSGYKPYKCSQCPYACRQPYSLTQHMKQHSSDAPQAHRPHVCLVCQKTFTTLAMLTSHSRAVHQAIF